MRGDERFREKRQNFKLFHFGFSMGLCLLLFYPCNLDCTSAKRHSTVITACALMLATPAPGRERRNL